MVCVYLDTIIDAYMEIGQISGAPMNRAAEIHSSACKWFAYYSAFPTWAAAWPEASLRDTVKERFIHHGNRYLEDCTPFYTFKSISSHILPMISLEVMQNTHTCPCFSIFLSTFIELMHTTISVLTLPLSFELVTTSQNLPSSQKCPRFASRMSNLGLNL